MRQMLLVPTWFLALSPLCAKAGPPITFEPNAGQAAPQARFLARAGSATLFIGSDHLAVAATRGGTGAAVRIRLQGANARAEVCGQERAHGKVSYLVGRDRRAWRTGLPTYCAVRASEVYPHTDLVYYGLPNGGIEHDFVLRPGAEPSRISMALEGAASVRLRGGALEIRTGLGAVILRAPVAYQVAAGRRQPVVAAYALTPARRGDPARVTLRVAAYDPNRTLVIDPVVEYATLIGAPTRDVCKAIKVAADGSMVVAVWTNSATYPTTPGAFDTTAGTGYNVAVTKLNAAGDALVYSTYLGGSGDDEPYGLALDGAGRAVVCGETLSADFPTTSGAYQTAAAGNADGFVARLNVDGTALDFCTLWGGAYTDTIAGVALSSDGRLYAAGSFQYLVNGGVRLQANVLEFAADGSAVLWRHEFGCRLNSVATCIAMGPGGDPYLGGWTNSDDFPTTVGCFQPGYVGVSGFFEGFVARLSPSGSVRWASLYGGQGSEEVAGVAVDVAGRLLACGSTTLASAPTTAGVYQHPGAGIDGFTALFSADGSALLFGSIVGGAKTDRAVAVGIDATGMVCVLGSTTSADMPVSVDAVKSTNVANISDAYLMRYSPVGAGATFASYLGGAGSDTAYGMALGAAGRIYVAGSTSSKPFPTTPICYSSTNQGNGDGFIMRLNMGLLPSIMYAPDRTGRPGYAVYLRGYLRNGVDRTWVAGKTLGFSVDGTSLGTAVTDSVGHAMLPIVVTQAVGDHALTVVFGGDGSFAGCSADAALRVTAGATCLWSIDRTAGPGQPTYLRGYLRRLPDYAWLAGKTLAFSIDGVEVGQAVTEASGCGSYLCTVPVDMLSGAHAILSEFRGDAEYDGSSFSSTLTVP
ncbi:MAG: SBBP repeat-containing protein [Armatimonadetes bacterium]|nr:SBBP repeat-containing protein [Armatimonadota bacterium]